MGWTFNMFVKIIECTPHCVQQINLNLNWSSRISWMNRRRLKTTSKNDMCSWTNKSHSVSNADFNFQITSFNRKPELSWQFLTISKFFVILSINSYQKQSNSVFKAKFLIKHQLSTDSNSMN